jgi:hypothetical protein
LDIFNSNTVDLRRMIWCCGILMGLDRDEGDD